MFCALNGNEIGKGIRKCIWSETQRCEGAIKNVDAILHVIVGIKRGPEPLAPNGQTRINGPGVVASTVATGPTFHAEMVHSDPKSEVSGAAIKNE